MELDIQVLLKRARDIGLKDSHITELCDISPRTLSRTKHGTTTLDSQELTDLNELIDCCEVMAAGGVPVLWSDISRVREQLRLIIEMRRSPSEPLSDAEKKLVRRYGEVEHYEDLAAEIGVYPHTLIDMLQRILLHARIIDVEARQKAKKATQ